MPVVKCDTQQCKFNDGEGSCVKDEIQIDDGYTCETGEEEDESA